jgi:hypothetical protein
LTLALALTWEAPFGCVVRIFLFVPAGIDLAQKSKLAAACRGEDG